MPELTKLDEVVRRTIELGSIHVNCESGCRNFRDRGGLVRARDLVEKHGYWRRKEELEDAEAAAVGWPA